MRKSRFTETQILRILRECLAAEVAGSIPGMRVIRVLERLIAVRVRPGTITVDNGPEITCRAMLQWA